METPVEELQVFKNLLVAIATGGSYDAVEYKNIRDRLSSEPSIKNALPDFVRRCRSAEEFWQFIKYEFQTYSERRKFIWDNLNKTIEYLEQEETAPSDKIITKNIEQFGAGYIQETWDKALQRREDDPEGAITVSRTLIETVCKYVLDTEAIEYENKADLPDLYRKVAKVLNLSPESHQQEIFKQILSGCISIVNGLGTLRNQLSDAHGKGKTYVKPAIRHATFVVNLSGTMSMFLLETYDTIKKSNENVE